MPRYNIKHPKTKMWRCYSSVVDDWVSDWMSEEDYKKWLIQEEIDRMNEDFEHFGIREGYITFEECEYRNQLNIQKCNNCKEEDCSDCKFNITFEMYKEQGDDYLHIFES